MLERWLAILAVVLPVFLCAGLGWFWTRGGRPFDRAMVTSLISSIGAPALVFHNLTSLQIDPAAVLAMAGAALAAVLLCVGLGWVLLSLLGLPVHTYLSPLAFGNSGNLGLAVCTLAFPASDGGAAPGLTLGIGFFAVTAMLQFTLGIAIWSGQWRLRELLHSPLTWAVVAAAAVLGAGLRLPRWLLNTTGILGDFAIPLMLITLGSSLGEIRLRSVRRALGLSLLRLSMGLGVGLGLSWALGFEGAARGVLILQCSMPPAVINWLLAERYGRASAEVAGVVVLSTLISFVTLPLLLAFLLE